MKRQIFALTALLALIGCEIDPPKPPLPPVPAIAPMVVPDFAPDSAYLAIRKQVDFGPRVPNTSAHRKCAAWLAAEFKKRGFTVTEQKFEAKHYKGTTFNCTNIIAQYRPELPKRILLAAHWDSRFMADHDTRDTLKPILGADDGASGVGIMLEIARVLQANPVDIGVDLICLDAEDQGDDNGEGTTWCLGSQYWATHTHRPDYQPYCAILLDMVGAKGARFLQEGASVQIAPTSVKKIWGLANQLGYGQYFINRVGSGITDDHIFIYKGAHIPMVDIISMPNDGEHPFGDYHHRHSDDMDVIDKATLKAVGHTCTAVIYEARNQRF